jgi:hypothetical protein
MNVQGIPVLYAIVTGSPPARSVSDLIDLAQADGWDVCLIASPNGRRFIDADALEVKTGHPVRSEYKEPGEPDVLPPADAMIAAPVTGNSLANWAVQNAIRNLSEWGVTMLLPDDMPGPDEPGTDEQHVTRLPWGAAWQAVLEHPRLSV